MSSFVAATIPAPTVAVKRHMDTLTVKPLTVLKQGLNLVIRRLIYARTTLNLRSQHTCINQFPVMAGFAVMDDEKYYSVPAIHISYSQH
ncbi:hypothetical protein MJO28_009523 [Puccinia striiformis f. sp. tritici]|uniref:Uncharacterized protein n=1 Tax=Puccinia striiformis f. sp. tritici TaxID=168172 RepID=A0ACC0E9G8_9BASI|nr:hypothetical protein MJO28_009523 [Puccinia striiformis f. sp. tritici]